MTVGLGHYLVLSAVLFTLGIFAVLTQKNAIRVLMGIELILNAAALNFTAFSRFTESGYRGQVFSLFIIVLAAAEAAIALAIVLGIFRAFREIDLDEIDSLRG